jgi:hypothetical protein
MTTMMKESAVDNSTDAAHIPVANIPPTNPSTAESKNVVTGGAKLRNNRLSSISKKYDIGGKGMLDEAEQAMRDMDSENLGYLTNEKVYRILKEQIETQNKLCV